MNKKKCSILLLISVLIVSAGCSSLIHGKQNILTPSTSLPATSTSVPATNTPITTNAITENTPIATLSPPEVINKIVQIMKTNGECQLPCIWGIAPGMTEPNQVIDIIQQCLDQGPSDLVEAPDLYVSSWSQEDITFGLLKNNTYFMLDYWFYHFDESNPQILVLNLYALDLLGKDEFGIQKFGSNYESNEFIEFVEYFSLPKIFSLYGKPNQILFGTWPEDPQLPEDQFLEFIIRLDYSDKGFFVEYASLKSIEENAIVVCPLQSHITVAAFSLESGYSTEYALKKAGFAYPDIRNASFYKPLGEPMPFTESEFYNLYQDNLINQCFEVPANIW